MNYFKLFGWGIVFWLVAFALVSVLLVYGIWDNFLAKLSIPVIVAILAFFAGKNIKQTSAIGVLKYSVVWVIIGVILDIFISRPYAGWGIFAQWNLWLGYAAILLIPLLSFKCCSPKTPQQPTV